MVEGTWVWKPYFGMDDWDDNRYGYQRNDIGSLGTGFAGLPKLTVETYPKKRIQS